MTMIPSMRKLLERMRRLCEEELFSRAFFALQSKQSALEIRATSLAAKPDHDLSRAAMRNS